MVPKMLMMKYPKAVIIALLSCWFIAFLPTLVEMERVWRGSDTYMHAYLVPVIALWVAYEKRKTIELRASWLFMLFNLVFTALWLIGYAAEVNSVSQFSAVLVLQATILSILSPQSRKDYLFPIFFLIFLVPFGEEFNPALQNMTASMTVELLRFIGVPVYREGLFLMTPIGQFEVAEACSGLRFLVASVVIGTLYAYLTYTSFIRQVLFIILLIIVSIIANGVRASLLIWLAEISNYQLGFGDDHYVYGWVVFGLTMFGMFWIGSFFAQNKKDTHKTVNETSNSDNEPTKIQYFSEQHILAMLACTLIVFAGNKLFQTTLQGEQPPLVPFELKAPAGFILSNNDPLGITFNDGFSRINALSNEGTQLFYASYAAKQSKGEMINWDNRIYNPKKWAVLKQQSINTSQGDIKYLELKSGQEIRRVVYWFEVDGMQTSKPTLVKLLQLYSMFFKTPGQSSIRLLAGDETQSLEQLIEKAKVFSNFVAQPVDANH